MKKFLFALAALSLLMACTPEKTPGGDNNNNGGNSQPSVVELTGIALTEHAITLEKGGNKVLEIKLTPANATNKSVTWVSSNTSIVTVTDGVVVGVAPGSTEIIAKSGNYTDKCQVTVVVSATSVSLDLTELTLSPGETATLKATVLPEDSTDEVEWSSSDETVATVQNGVVTAVAEGEATITAKAGEKTATCSVKVEIKMNAVDLGLSVKWADCNLGAAKPEDYGDYYAWGETTPKEDYSWSTYKWGTSSTSLTKYNTDSSRGPVDNKTVLEPSDDVASVKLGGKWRMPTVEEWDELLDVCTCTLMTENEVDGLKVVAPNGHSIFLPAAGQGHGTAFAGGIGEYWSSSLNPFYPQDAAFLSFNSVSFGTGYYFRFTGRSVRAVTE